MGQTVVDINDLSRSFGRKSAIDRVSFHATAGQTFLARAGRSRQPVEMA